MRQGSRWTAVAGLMVALGASGCWLSKLGDAGESSDGGASVPGGGMTGSAAVRGASGHRLQVVAQTLDGEKVAEAVSDFTGAFSLSLPAGERRRLLIAAVDGSNPEGRAYTLYDPAATTTQAVNGLRLDDASTANVLALAATGRLREGPPVTAHSKQIADLKTAIGTGAPKLCSGAPTPASSAAIRELITKAAEEGWTPSLVKEILTAAQGTGGPAARMMAMQQRISRSIRSVNKSQILQNPVGGVLTLVTERVAIGALTNQTINEITDEPVSQGDLGYLAGIIAGGGWGNCREKAFLGAFAASLLPEVQQLAVAGLIMKDGGNHAVAIACLDGTEVVNLTQLSVVNGQIQPAGITAGRCVVVDPWMGPPGDTGAGHTAVLGPTYATAMAWGDLAALKPVKLKDRLAVPGRTGKSMPDCDCARPAGQPRECTPFAVTPPDAGAPAPAPDAGPGNRFTAEIIVSGMNVPFTTTPASVGTGWPSGGTRHDPVIVAFSGTDFTTSPSITLQLNPNVIKGPGTFRFGSVGDFWADKVGGELSFGSPALTDESGEPLLFSAQPGGDLHLTAWGATPGSRVTGDFECNISATHYSKAQGRNVSTTGSIHGTFDVILSPP